ncbi:MAG TPA: dihydrofolate reductase family protein [Saprospiraceae bacterium]|nr:dihydrofolate reductase family protein [Saprospiraceae bacterium]
MRTISTLMHISLDGFIGRSKGDLGWIHLNDNIFDLSRELTEAADTALYGRVTWQMMEAYWPTADQKPNATKHDFEHAAWYRTVPKYVMSNTMNSGGDQKTHFIHGDIADQIKALKAQPGKNIQVFGSPGATQSLLRLGLVDEIWLMINPIVLGSGIRYFKEGDPGFELELAGDPRKYGDVIATHHYVRK